MDGTNSKGARNLLSCAIPDWTHSISRETIRADAIAGLTGATLVLPQGVAFAAIAGLPPQYGFYTAMIVPVIAALTGSSWHAVSGPTTAISVMVFASLSGRFVPGSPEFITAAIVLTLLVGLIQIALGLARLGGLVDFVSHSVMTGFVAGAAILIGLTQFKHVLGLDLPASDHVAELVQTALAQIGDADWRTILIAALALSTGAAVRLWQQHLPNYLFALLVASIASLLLGGESAGIATVGALNEIIPAFAVPEISFGLLRDLGNPALAIALVGLLEAISVSRAIAIRSGQMLEGNREFLGQGLSNAIGSMFQCYPGSASFTRSGVNYDAGARTPMSAIFAAIFLFLILLVIAPVFAVVPIAGMAGVILLVAWRLIDFKEIRHLVTSSSRESVIAGVTFLSVLFIGLEPAIYAGVLLSLAFFLQSAARPFLGQGAPDPNSPRRVFKNAASNNLPECPQLMVARLDGPLFFGSVEFLRRELRRLEQERSSQKHMLFIVKGNGDIDLAGADLLLEEATRRQRRGGSLHLQVKTPKTLEKLARYKVIRGLSKDRIHLSKGDAIAAIVPTLDPRICAQCSSKIFLECSGRPKAVGDEIENLQV